LEPFLYTDEDRLVAMLVERVIGPAEAWLAREATR
jgi:hypothetical protein